MNNSTKQNQHTVKELQDVIKNVEKIIRVLDKKQIFGQEERENYFFEHHNDIMGKYPFLISHLCSNTNNDMLDIMLRHIEEVEIGEKTKEEAELIVREKLAANFIPKNK